MPAVTHWRETVSALPSRPAITMPPTFGVKPAIVSKVRLRAFQSSMFGRRGEARASRSDVSRIVTSRSGSVYGSGRSSVASTSAKIALLAPMPSASVATAIARERGRRRQLAEGELHVVAGALRASG